MKPKNFPKRKKARREAAQARQAEWSDLSGAEKLDRLEARGHGDCKQADKLRTHVAAEACK